MGEARLDVRFDTMSVNVGSSPLVPRGLAWESRGGGGLVTLVKPIAGFAEQWEAICGRFQKSGVNGEGGREPVYSVGKRSFVHVCIHIDRLFVLSFLCSIVLSITLRYPLHIATILCCLLTRRTSVNAIIFLFPLLFTA